MRDQARLWTWPFILVLIINAFNGVASYMINPILPDYLAEKGVLFSVIGIISSLISWIALVFRPLSGLMSDRLNRKKVVFFSYLASALCMAAYAVSDQVSAIVIVRILHGIAFGLSGTISMAFATSFLPSRRIAEGMNYIGIASLIGTMFGPQLGTLFSERAGMSFTFLVAGALYLFCLFLIALVPGKPAPRQGTHRIQLQDLFAVQLIVYVILIGLFSFGNSLVSYYLVSFGQSRHIEGVALFFTVYSLAMLMMKPFVGRLQDAKGVRVILIPALLVNALAMILLAQSFTLLMVLIAAVLKAVGQGNGSPAIQSEAVKQLGLTRSGVALSTCLIGQDIGNALGPIYGGFLIEHAGYQCMFLIYAAMLAAGCVLYLMTGRKRKREEMRT